MKELIFKLSEFEFIKLVPDHGMDCEYIQSCCDHVRMYFMSEGKELELAHSSSGDAIERLGSLLQKALDNKLQIHESIVQNLGLMKNEYWYEYPGNIHNAMFYQVPCKQSEGAYWVGENYQLWSVTGSTNPFTTTWLYNDEKGNIVLEVTPLYRWSFRENELADPNFITYDEFRKNYHSLFRCLIPRAIAQAWLKRSVRWYKLFYKNEQIANATRNRRDVFYFKAKLRDNYDSDKDAVGNMWYWDEKKQEWIIKTKYGFIHRDVDGLLSHQGILAQADISRFMKVVKI